MGVGYYCPSLVRFWSNPSLFESSKGKPEKKIKLDIKYWTSPTCINFRFDIDRYTSTYFIAKIIVIVSSLQPHITSHHIIVSLEVLLVQPTLFLHHPLGSSLLLVQSTSTSISRQQAILRHGGHRSYRAGPRVSHKKTSGFDLLHIYYLTNTTHTQRHFLLAPECGIWHEI